MPRVVLMRSGVYRNCLFRAGHVHDLPEEFASSLLADQWAYVEGEEPPIAPIDLAEMNKAKDLQISTTAEIARKRVALLSRLADEQDRQQSIADEAKERGERLRAERAARQPRPQHPIPERSR